MTAEEYIKIHTSIGINSISQWKGTIHGSRYQEIVGFHPWLTPDDARNAVKIAKEEAIEKAYEWLENLYAPDGSIVPENIRILKDFRKAMED